MTIFTLILVDFVAPLGAIRYTERMITINESAASPAPPPRPRMPLVSAASVAHLSGEELASQVTFLVAQISAATYQFLVLLEELDRRRPWAGFGISSTAQWLSVKCGMDLRAGYEHVRVARALPLLPRISAAFARGQLSYSKVRAMTRVATPENDAKLANLAVGATASQLERLLSLYRRCERQRETERAAEQHRDRSFRVSKLADGSVFLEGRLPPDLGALFLEAFAVAREALRQQQSGAERVAECSAEHSEGTATRPHADDRRGREACDADALMVIAETVLAHGASAAEGSDRHQVVVHVNESALPSDGDASSPELADGTPVATETVRRIACDCSKLCVHEDGDGEILSVGRQTRQIPSALKRALRTRDRGCVFPGCTNHRFVDAHHIQHWADGGETRLTNLVLLCRRHHVLVHEGGYRAERSEAGFRFHPPSGPPIEAERLGGDTFLDAVGEIVERHDAAAYGITPRTILPDWYGEPILWSWAVEDLQNATHPRGRPH